MSRARAVTEDLAARCYILEEDVELAVEAAAERYDAFASTPAGAAH